MVALAGSVALLSFLPADGADPVPPASSHALAEFTAADAEALGWRVVDDGVMGGLSKGKFSLTPEGTARFEGTLSLENNGGFSSVRTERMEEKLDLSKRKGLRLRVKGDGRTYQVRLESDARYRESRVVSFKADFTTSKGEWIEVEVPFSAFEGSWRGRELPEAELNTATIERLGLILADKQPGTFALEVDWIRSYGG